MNASPTPNAITQRLEKLSLLWEQFRSLPEARICRWLVHPDEVKMVDAFLESTYLEDNPTTDFFLPFYTEFVYPEDYSGQLLKELNQSIEADKDNLAEQGINLTWAPEQTKEGQELTTAHFLHQLALFAEQVPAAELVVAVLLPKTVNRKFGKWLYETTKLNIPANIRLLVLDQVGAEVLTKAAEKSPDRIITTALSLNMPDAMRQLASAGNPADPGVKFRKAFLDLSQAAANKNLSEIQRLEVIPLVIAREQGWVPMEIAVHSLVASAYIGLNQLPNALQRYDQAYGLAKKAHAAGEKVGLTLAVQCLFNKGSVLIAQKAFPEAIKTFALAATHAQEANDNFQVMEAKRMQGYCLEKSSEWEEAFRIEKEALATAALLDENIRLNSTLPYLGQALLNLAYQMGYKTQYLELEEKLNALAGPGWQNKLQTTKAAVV
jgi:tetratricopeptide (TPR) repeat protein